MKAIIHIGMEKTGTTSIQACIRNNLPTLRRNRILVPKSLGRVPSRSLVMMGVEQGTVERNHLLAGLKTPGEVDEHVAEVSKSLRNEIGSSSCDRVLLSNELLSNRLYNAERIERFAEWVFDHFDEAEILIYLRRQDHMLLAMYSTLIKVGFSDRFHVPKASTRDPNKLDKYDYHALLEAWAQPFGAESIRVRVFERDQLEGGDAVADFAHSLGLPQLASRPASRRQNERLDAHGLEFLRRFNGVVPYMVEGRLNPERAGLITALEGIAEHGPPLGWSGPVSRAEFLERYANGNASIAREYLGRDDGTLFREAMPADANSPVAFDPDAAVKIAADLWLAQRRRIQELEAQLEAGPAATDKAEGGAQSEAVNQPGRLDQVLRRLPSEVRERLSVLRGKDRP